MPVLRFITGLLLLAAVVTLVSDANGWLMGSGPFRAKSLLQHWTEISPKSLAAFRGSVSAATSPKLWDGLVAPAFAIPTSLLFMVAGIVCGWLGRRRRRIDVYAN